MKADSGVPASLALGCQAVLGFRQFSAANELAKYADVALRQ